MKFMDLLKVKSLESNFSLKYLRYLLLFLLNLNLNNSPQKIINIIISKNFIINDLFLLFIIDLGWKTLLLLKKILVSKFNSYF